MSGLSEYEVAWGSAALLFTFAGARALCAESRLRGATPGLVLRTAPACAALLALVGARLHALLGSPTALWQTLADGGFWEVATSGGQRITGGLLLAAAFLSFVVPWACTRCLQAGEILDALVPATGAAIAVGRVGCFLAGCCFGVPSSAPWAMEYAANTAAYWNHIAQGLIEGERTSLAVHPLPLYLGGIAALAALGSHKLVRPSARCPGISAVTFAVALSGARLLVEPLREIRFLGGVPGQQVLSSSIFSIGLVLLFLLVRRPGPPRDHWGGKVAKGDEPSSPGTPSR